MTTLLLLALLGATYQGHYTGVECVGPGGATMVGTLTMSDDIQLCFGDSTCDYWLIYNSSGTQFELWTTDSDGAGADGAIMTCPDGGDDCAFAGVVTFTNTGLHLLDTNASHDLIIAPGSDITADRTLTLTTGDANRAVTLSADLTVESTSTVNQDLTTDANVQFAQCTVGNTGLVVGASTPFSDSTGTLTLQTVDALDATTETTIEGAIDTLANLTSVQSQAVSLSGSLTVESAATVNQDTTTDANVQFAQCTVGNTGLVVGASTPFSDSTGTLTLQTVDALDATTETTIEGAIDTLANLTSVQSQAVSLSGSLTVESAATVNQDTTTDATPSWATVTASTGPVTSASDSNGLCTGASGCTDLEIEYDGALGHLRCAADIQAEASLVVGVTEIEPDSGMVTVINQENTSIGAGTPFGECLATESVANICAYAEGDGGGGAQNRRVGIHEVAPETTMEITAVNPYVSLTSTVAEDSDGGRESRWIFQGTQSGAEETHLAWIEVSHSGTGDDEKGKLKFYVNNGSDGDSPTLAMTLDETDLSIFDDSGNGLYWREFHLSATKVDPGGSGATLTIVNTASFVYLLDATNEYLYFGADIHDDWDAASDVVVEIRVALSAAETANDDIEAEVIAEYHGEHDDFDTSFKTQTRTVNHDIGSDNAQGSIHYLVFVLDYDLASNVIEVEDSIKFRFRLDSVGSVAGVHFIGAQIKYRTAKTGIPVGTFPTEG